ncbi:MAG: hypothetical protein AAGA65_26250 [Actinomycetota bacterium]
MFRTKPGEERALIEDWINRPALRKLVEAFGGTWPEGDLETVVAALAEFSDLWDYRAGKHDRHFFHDKKETSDPYQDLTYWTAKELGMIEPPPPSRSSYDYLLILGGLATGVEPRIRYAMHLVAEGLGVERQIAALGSFRHLQDRELPVSTRYAPEGRYEVDHLAAMLAELFGVEESWSIRPRGQPEVDPALASLSAIKMREVGPDLGIYAAASSDPEGRPANTADTFHFLAEVNDLEAGQEVLIVTSGIYLPYQHLDAVRTLSPYRLGIETVGVVGDQPGPTHSAAAYRQEIRSTLRSARASLPSQ